MTRIAGPVAQVLDAQQQATAQRISFAVAATQLDQQRQVGDSINQLLEQNVETQRQLSPSPSRLDVRA